MVETITREMSFEEALEVFKKGDRKVEPVVREARQRLREAKQRMESAQAVASEVDKNYERLSALRYLRLLEILEGRGLGICSVECLPGEFPDPQNGVGLHRQQKDQHERLGFFPKENITYIWYEQEAPNEGTYATGSYRRGLLMQLCPRHMALLPAKNLVVPDPYGTYEPLVLSRVEIRDREFVSVVNNEIIDARVELQFSEEHYKLFGLAPLPDSKTLKR